MKKGIDSFRGWLGLLKQDGQLLAIEKAVVS